jgi:hypothetical protein
LELDCYDCRSLHFGLFECTNGESKPVGYIRIVTDEERHWAEAIREIAAEIPAVAEKVNAMPEVPFPLMTYFPDVEAVEMQYRAAKARGRATVEAGRLSLEDTARGIPIARHIVASTVTIALVNNVSEALLTCVPTHARFYRPYGFSQAEGTSVHFCEETKTEFVCQHWNKENMSAETRAIVMKMAEAYRATGRICFNPQNPEQFHEPKLQETAISPRMSLAA